MIHVPLLQIVATEEREAVDYLEDPTDPDLCLEDIDPANRYEIMQKYPECTFSNLGSTVNFWRIAQATDRITMGFKMPTDAAFTSMPNSESTILGGRFQLRGYNDLTHRGYPLRKGLSIGLAHIAVASAERLLSTKRPVLPTSVPEGLSLYEATSVFKCDCADCFLLTGCLTHFGKSFRDAQSLCPSLFPSK